MKNKGNDLEYFLKQQDAIVRLAKEEFIDLNSALRKITERDAKTLSVARVSIWIFNNDHSTIESLDLYWLSKDKHETGTVLTLRQYPRYFEALEKSRTISASNASADPRTSEFKDGYLSLFEITSMMDAPIRLQGKTIGIVRHEHIGNTREWTHDEQNFAASIADMVSLVIEALEHKKTGEKLEILNKKLFRTNKKLEQLVLKDYVTGLYNYRYFKDMIEAEISRCKRYAHPLSVIMLDIDYFKSITNTYGNQFGDLVLKQFAIQLKKMVHQYDTVIRLGGEEFLIILPGTDRSSALIMAKRILETIKLCNLGDKKQIVKIKLSGAVSSYPEDKISKGIALLNHAEQILDKVKEDGGDRIYTSVHIEKVNTPAPDEINDVRLLKERINKLTKHANQSIIESILAFAKTIELRDHYTGEHVELTVQYATEIATSLSLSDDEIECIRQASVLHDLGKIGISDKILLKKGKLSKKEFEEIKKHPQIGVDIIRPIQFLHNLIPLILYHHERWDGKGYPYGLKKEEIPIGARIIALADVYQALISDRPYRKAYPRDSAIKIIKEEAGTKLDPAIVDVFLKIP